MDFDIDLSKLLYGLGAFLGVLSIIYFGQEIILDLSPTVKSLIMVLAAAGFLSAGEYTQRKNLMSSFYIFSAFSYLSFLFYTVLKFRLSSETTFLLLAVSSAIFMILGYLRSGKGYEIDKRYARNVLIAVVIMIGVLVSADVVGPQPEYDLNLEDSVEVVDGEEFNLGVLTVRNDFIFSRNVDIPRYTGCISNSEIEYLHLDPDIEGNVLGGMSSKDLELADTVGSRPNTNQSFSGNYTVVNDRCPEDPDDGKIYIQDGDTVDRLVERRR